MILQQSQIFCTITVYINVTQATPTIIWNNPANIVYGTPLSSIQLDATASVPGRFIYNPPSGTVLSVGTHTLTATFTPTDTVDYNTASKTVSITVMKATPTITWNNPANIVYGTPLNTAQLKASAVVLASNNTKLNASDNQIGAFTSVPGTFTYTPAAGTVLSVGTHTLTATFTPNDSTHYNTATASVSINVIQAVQGAALALVKSVSPTTYDSVGQTIAYTYTVTNYGNVSISAPITVTDDKFGTVPIQSSGTLSPGSSITGTATYKITDADINTGSVANLASATGSFNGKTITSSNGVIAVVPYEQQTNDRDNNGGYGSAVVPVVPAPMMYSSPMYGSVPGEYSSEPYGYSSKPSGAIETQNSESNGHKAKAHLSKHKHKHHTTKHHKTAKNNSKQRN